MDKFNNALSRSQERKDDEGGSHQFVERLDTKASPFIIDKASGQTLSLSELSSIEKDIYNAWWNELDPFGLGIVVDEVMHPFLQASGLVEDTLGQIIDCYAGGPRYTEDQFYAILRLVAHEQSGRKINRDLVALGAPLANFDQEAIDSLFRQGNNNNNNTDCLRPTSTQTTGKDFVRNPWWGQSLPSQKDTLGATLFITSEQQHNHLHHQQQQQQQRFDTSTTPTCRHSYTELQVPPISDVGNNGQTSSGTCSATTLLPYHQHQLRSFDWAEQALSTSTTHENIQLLAFKPPPNPTITPHATTTRNSKNTYSHSRSRSVPYASQDMPSADAFLFDTITATPSKQDHLRPALMSSRSSMDTADFYRLHHQQSSTDHGQSLLLTQTFIPPASTTKSTNPFDDDDGGGGGKMGVTIVEGDTMTPTQHQQGNSKSPFVDTTVEENEESLLSTTKAAPTAIIPVDIDNTTPFTSSGPTCITTNQQSNRNNIPAPTIPPQSTKPVLPRYTRNQPLKKSQSQHNGQKHSVMSQGAFLLATSSSSSSVKFPMAPLKTTTATMPSDNTDRLFKH